MALPRLLVLMGSGETAPTMTGHHRRIFERLGGHHVGGRQVGAVMLDTPFGFQENATILADKSVEYFRESVFRPVQVAGLSRMDTGDVVAIESGIARVRAAEWVFAGPGSPTFALSQWAGTPVPGLLADKLRNGGAVVFSSAAALTVGAKTVPVYEIYKVGIDPFWLDGLNLLAELGIDASVIPHFNNTEGGNHDTRFCYLGERRLAMLEPELPEGGFVLGVDEHTGIVMDLDDDTAEIVGKGVVTLRREGRSVELQSGTVVGLDVIRSGGDLSASQPVPSPLPPQDSVADHAAPTLDSLVAALDLCQQNFDQALADADADRAVEAMLNLDSAIVEWSRDTLQSDQIDRAHSALRSMIVQLGAAATRGLQDARVVLGPVVEAALVARRVARDEKAWAVSDALRDALDHAGIEVRDTTDGVEWLVR
jgi:cyanophycinase-like exopeptidase